MHPGNTRATVRQSAPLSPASLTSCSLALLFLLASVLPASAGMSSPPASLLGIGAAPSGVEVLELPRLDVSALLSEDEAASMTSPGPIRYAEPMDVFVTPSSHGTRETLPTGERLWRLAIRAPGATDLNLGFASCNLPYGATIHVSSRVRDYYQGPYTAEDVTETGELWLPVVPGDECVLEMLVPEKVKAEPRFELTHVGYGYRDLFHLQVPGGRQGWCNNDVICPEGDPWRDEIQSVAVYSTGGSLMCTGSMVNNTNGDFRNYFLTANHCGVTSGNASSLVVYWNYESPSCGALSGGSLSQNQSGATFRARRSDVDFCLVELNSDPNPAYQVYYAGWDNSGSTPGGSVGIHHPNTDEKAISFNTNSLSTGNSCIGSGGSNTHWYVDDWEDGTTEPGSSGSGLWDSGTHSLVGFLSGGLASCSNINYDCYGKFSVAWNGSSSSARLKDWLDPGNTGASSVAGSYPSGIGSLQFVAEASTDACPSSAANVNGIWEPGETITVSVDLRASGGDHTGIQGVLSSSTPGVSVTDGTASWSNMANGTVATSQSPHFTLELDPTIGCGTTIALDLSVSSAEGGPWSHSFSGTVGEQLMPSGLPASIPDNSSAGVSTTLDVGSSFTLSDVNVNVSINHSYVGDLKIVLQSPSGTSVTLLDRPGRTTSGYGCSDNDMAVTFDDASGVNLESHCSGTTPWYSGTGAPFASLSAFNGQNVSGTWTLTVSDHAGSDTGSVTSWSLDTTPVLQGACTVCEDTQTGVGEVSQAASGEFLSANRPNPFDGVTEISFHLSGSSTARLDVFDVSGRLVRTLVDGVHKAGSHTARWDGRDSAGRLVSAGVYFYRLEAEGRTEMQRMSVLR